MQTRGQSIPENRKGKGPEAGAALQEQTEAGALEDRERGEERAERSEPRSSGDLKGVGVLFYVEGDACRGF